MFFKATAVQVVLLFGNETWNITKCMMKMLDGFQLRAAWCMATVNKQRMYLLEKVGLYTMSHYINVRRQTICNFIFNETIFE